MRYWDLNSRQRGKRIYNKLATFIEHELNRQIVDHTLYFKIFIINLIENIITQKQSDESQLTVQRTIEIQLRKSDQRVLWKESVWYQLDGLVLELLQNVIDRGELVQSWAEETPASFHFLPKHSCFKETYCIYGTSFSKEGKSMVL